MKMSKKNCHVRERILPSPGLHDEGDKIFRIQNSFLFFFWGFTMAATFKQSAKLSM